MVPAFEATIAEPYWLVTDKSEYALAVTLFPLVSAETPYIEGYKLASYE